MPVIDHRVEVAHAVVEPTITVDIECRVAREHLDRVEPEREGRWPRDAIPADGVVQRIDAKPWVIDLHDRMRRHRAPELEQLLRVAIDDLVRGWRSTAWQVAIERHWIDVDVLGVRGELVTRDRCDRAGQL